MKTALEPMIAKLNKLVSATFPPKKIVNGMKCGSELYYYGASSVLVIDGTPPWSRHQWILDGMTPVQLPYVLSALKEKGCDVSEFVAHFKAQQDEWEAVLNKRKQLRASAKSKLTEEEANACGL